VSDFVEHACQTIKAAVDAGKTLRVRGGGSKAFYGRDIEGDPLETTGHAGIVDYEPSELVVTARAGTRLADLEAALDEHGQMLAFEPPHYGEGATIGGAVAAGLSGPRRPYAGAVRDLVLGCRIINGFGEALAFGGQVMKNVAGYDISRLMAGSQGTLGVITEVSMKVLPVPPAQRILAFDCDQREAIERMNRWAGQPLPLSATCHDGERLYARLAGTEAGVRSAAAKLGGEVLDDEAFWTRVREQTLPFFESASTVWRLSLPPASGPVDLPGRVFLEWNGGLRWVSTDAPGEQIRAAVAAAGGHATRFRGHDGDDVFHPLDPALLTLHRKLKHAFDPYRVLNRGRIYPEL